MIKMYITPWRPHLTLGLELAGKIGHDSLSLRVSDFETDHPGLDGWSAPEVIHGSEVVGPQVRAVQVRGEVGEVLEGQEVRSGGQVLTSECLELCLLLLSEGWGEALSLPAAE